MKINLNLKASDGSVPNSVSSMSSEYYPEFTVTQQIEADDTEPDYDLDDLPDTGEMTVKYAMTRTNENKKTGICTYTFEVREIVSASSKKSKAPAKNYGEDAGAALDRLAKEKADEEGEY